jgi:Tfp pilus assembly protein PilX
MSTIRQGPGSVWAREGVSLVETVISVFILTLVIMSIMMAMIVSTRNATVMKDDENAHQFALEVLEDCERVPFDADDAVYLTAIAGKSRVRNSDDVRRMRADAAAVVSAARDTAGRPVSADVTVLVTWNSALGGTKTIPMTREVSVSGWQNVGDKSY